MSLTVSPEFLEKAQHGPVSDDDFIASLWHSLPYAWSVVTDVAERLANGGGPFADNQAEPPDEASRGQLLRLVGSDAMRSAGERRFAVRLAFQNCPRPALFAP